MYLCVVNTVIRHIEYLIARCDCVIIPGLGAILAKHEGARIDYDTMQIFPPMRVFTFNKDISVSDGILAHSIARAESIRYELACKKMEAGIDMLQRQLRINGSIELGHLGTLRQSYIDGTISFEPASANEVISKSLCYRPVQLAPDVATQIAYAGEQAPDNTSSAGNGLSKSLKKFARVAASVAILAGVCFLTSTPVSVEQSDLYNTPAKASLAPEIKSTPVEDLIPQTPTLLNITTDYKYKTYSTIAPEPEAATESENAISGHYVVVATVRTPQEVEKFMKQHSSDTLHSACTGKHYIVYASHHTSREEAIQAMRQSSGKYQGVWVYSK